MKVKAPSICSSLHGLEISSLLFVTILTFGRKLLEVTERMSLCYDRNLFPPQG